MSRSRHDAHFTALHVAHEARKVGWGDNLAPDTGIVQPTERVQSQHSPSAGTQYDQRVARGGLRESPDEMAQAQRSVPHTIGHAQKLRPSAKVPGSVDAPTLLGHSPSKYHNRRTDGYASRREAKRAAVLRLLQDTRVISNLREQVEFVLIPRQLDERGKVAERACIYRADFVYTDNATGREIVEDSKGVRTADYIIKRKLMRFTQGIVIRET